MVGANLGTGTYPSPAPQPQNQGQHERLRRAQGSQVGGGLKSVFISCTDLADEAAVGKNLRLFTWIRSQYGSPCGPFIIGLIVI